MSRASVGPVLVGAVRALAALAESAVQAGLTGHGPAHFRPGETIAVVDDLAALHEHITARGQLDRPHDPAARAAYIADLLRFAARGFKPAPGIRVVYRRPRVTVDVSPASQAVSRLP